MSTYYANGELLKKWRREAMATMRAQYIRLQTAAESCQSHKDGNPGDYAKSLAIIAGCYLRAAECFAEPSEYDKESNTPISGSDPAQQGMGGGARPQQGEGGSGTGRQGEGVA